MIADANGLFIGVAEHKSDGACDAGRGHMKEAIAGAVSSAKPILKDAADAAKPFVPLAAAVVSTAFPAASAVSDAVEKALGANKQGANAASDTEAGRMGMVSAQTEGGMADGLDMLTKLKGLVDSGVITQEEFDAKKRQILGI